MSAPPAPLRARALAEAAAWAGACAAAWFAFAWLALGILPSVLLLGALTADTLRPGRRSVARHGLPRPVDGHLAATWLALALVLVQLVGYRPDPLVQGLLAGAAFAKGAAAWRGAARRA